MNRTKIRQLILIFAALVFGSGVWMAWRWHTLTPEQALEEALDEGDGIVCVGQNVNGEKFVGIGEDECLDKE